MLQSASCLPPASFVKVPIGHGSGSLAPTPHQDPAGHGYALPVLLSAMLVGVGESASELQI